MVGFKPLTTVRKSGEATAPELRRARATGKDKRKEPQLTGSSWRWSGRPEEPGDVDLDGGSPQRRKNASGRSSGAHGSSARTPSGPHALLEPPGTGGNVQGAPMEEIERRQSSARVGEKGDEAVDSEHPASIPSTGRRRATRRSCRHARLRSGQPAAAGLHDGGAAVLRRLRARERKGEGVLELV